jgi:hypothetical protein
MRVGIDFGETIARVEFPDPFPFAFDTIRHLVHKFGPTNVFVVSKAKMDMRQRILAWMDQAQIYRRTGLLRENIIFVFHHDDKVGVAERLDLNLFFDDSAKVVRRLVSVNSVQRIFWMHADPREVELIRPRHLRPKVSITKGWNTTIKYLQRIPNE